MKVEKNGVTYTLNSQAQVDAFLSDGWTEVTEKAAPKKVADSEPTETVAKKVTKKKTTEK